MDEFRLLTAVEKTQAVAAYMKQLFRQNDIHERVPMMNWRTGLLKECRFIVKVVKQAVENQKSTNWSVKDYVKELRRWPRCTGMNDKLELELMKKFPPIEGQDRDEYSPSTITDEAGYIMMWYLPGLLSEPRRYLVWESVQLLEKRLQIKKNGNWRSNPTYFHIDEIFQHKSGTVNFALAWYQQGMEETELGVEVSAEMRGKAAQEWMREMEDTAAILAGITALINPSLFDAGMTCLETIARNPDRVSKNDDLLKILSYWSSPYMTQSLISNRDTPFHRDNGGGYACLDLLVTLGDYKDAGSTFLDWATISFILVGRWWVFVAGLFDMGPQQLARESAGRSIVVAVC